MTIFMVVASAAAPVLVAGLRGAATARDVTQTKGVAQAQLEKMRDMPYYVGRAAGEFLDVLDTYYPNVTSTPTVTPSCASATVSSLPPTGWSAYVSGGASGTV